MTLEEYENEEIRLKSALGDVQAEILRLKRAAAPVHAGDIVKHKRHGLCKVTSVDVSFGFNRPWAKALTKKKDGNWGREVNLYSEWELVEPCTQPDEAATP